MSYINIYGNVRTTQVDTSYASKVQGDRIFTPSHNVCPKFLGYDNLGRPVAPDTFNTKAAGCNTPLDRTFVENDLRPKYVWGSQYDLDRSMYAGGSRTLPNTHVDTKVLQDTKVMNQTNEGYTKMQTKKYRTLSGMTKKY